MDKYELIVVVDAALLQEEKESIIKEVADIIGKMEGKIINSQVWIDKQRFFFLMKKKREGTYYLVIFEAPRSAISKLRQLLRQNERILRSMIIKAGA